MRKRLVIALGIAGLATAVLFLAFRLYTPAIHLFTWSITVIVATVFEPWRYSPKVNRSSGRWQATRERFNDPVPGDRVKVFYNLGAGERDNHGAEHPQCRSGDVTAFSVLVDAATSSAVLNHWNGRSRVVNSPPKPSKRTTENAFETRRIRRQTVPASTRTFHDEPSTAGRRFRFVFRPCCLRTASISRPD
jgi:hypothetical protein